MQKNELCARLEQEIPHLRRFARYLAREIDLADDLVQECLTRAIAKLDSWEPGTNLRAWLFVILRNVYISELRRSARMTTVDVSPEELPEHSVKASQETSLAMRDIEAAFQRLADDHREILLLIAVEGMKYEEAAEVLDVAIGTVRSRLSRARIALRELLGETTLP